MMDFSETPYFLATIDIEPRGSDSFKIFEICSAVNFDFAIFDPFPGLYSPLKRKYQPLQFIGGRSKARFSRSMIKENTIYPEEENAKATSKLDSLNYGLNYN